MGVKQVLASFGHTQTTPSKTWVINHGLSLPYPIVDVWVDDAGTLTKILPESVVVTSISVATVTFSVEQTGRAIVI